MSWEYDHRLNQCKISTIVLRMRRRSRWLSKIVVDLLPLHNPYHASCRRWLQLRHISIVLTTDCWLSKMIRHVLPLLDSPLRAASSIGTWFDGRWRLEDPTMASIKAEVFGRPPASWQVPQCMDCIWLIGSHTLTCYCLSRIHIFKSCSIAYLMASHRLSEIPSTHNKSSNNNGQTYQLVQFLALCSFGGLFFLNLFIVAARFTTSDDAVILVHWVFQTFRLFTFLILFQFENYLIIGHEVPT